MVPRTPLVLAGDVEIVPVASLPADVRARLGGEDGDHVASRSRGRSLARLLDAPSAALLRGFREPSTLVDAIVAFSRAHGLDAMELAEPALALIADALAAGFLVPADARAEAALAPGDRVDGFEIVHVVQDLDDAQLYRARAPGGEPAALKVSPRSDLLRHEAAVLELLGGDPAPRLLRRGEHRGRAYLAVSWCEGTTVDVAAAIARRECRTSPAAGHRLLALCLAVLETYARLHARGVVHGDVHPRNAIVSPGGAIRLVDFALARAAGAPSPVERGGLGHFLDPEHAGALLRGEAPPSASERSEQYAVAALLHALAGGEHYLDLSLDRERALRQIVEAPPRRFSVAGVECPPLDAVIAVALRKDPDARHASLAGLRDGFAEAMPLAAPLLRGLGAAAGAAAERIAAARAQLSARADDRPALASIALGTAGVAYACLRLAWLEDDAAMLAAAERHAARAVRIAGDPTAFALGGRILDRGSLLHGVAGVFLVEALVAHAACDERRRAAAVTRFAEEARRGAPLLELAEGRAGLLLGCAMLVEAFDDPAVIALGRELAEEVDRRTSELPPVGASDALPYSGIAHGWAGVLYAQLRWRCASPVPAPAIEARIQARLDELRGLAGEAGGGVRWPRARAPSGGDPAAWPGWCHGSAGHIPLWLLAHERWGDDRDLSLAQRAGWHTWEGEGGAGLDASLCCGLTGRAYAMLALFRVTEDRAWLDRSRRLAHLAAVAPMPMAYRATLYKGDLGLVLLDADLRAASSSSSSHPAFDREGWPARATP